ncbi:MAG: phosphoglucosamine mutase [Candidatus Bathyarchaeia archaeon]
MFTRRLFGTNGIRGVVNQDLTPEAVARIASAIGTYFGGGRLLIGYDYRTSSPMLAQAAMAGLVSTGCDVYNAGYAPTPAIQYATKHFEYDGAVIITASHNPPEYNGVKVVAPDGVEIPREEEIKIEDIFFEGGLRLREWKRLGRITQRPGVLESYKEGIKGHIDVDAVGEARFKVVVDPANSVGALVTPYLLRELGCEVITINAQLDGNFPGRMPEPRPENLRELSAAVLATGADLGVAHDGDADRAVFVDETGTVRWGDKTGATVVDYVLQSHPGGVVVTPVSSSRLIEEIVRARGGKLVWTRVGSIIVSRKMIEVDSVVSFEENGGVFYGPHQPVRDGAMATALILEIMAKRGSSMSQLVEELPSYHLTKKKVMCPNEMKQRVLERLISLTEGHERMTIDGVKILFEDGAVLIRPSGTEPIYRVYAEARSGERAREIANWGVDLVQKSL